MGVLRAVSDLDAGGCGTTQLLPNHCLRQCCKWGSLLCRLEVEWTNLADHPGELFVVLAEVSDGGGEFRDGHHIGRFIDEFSPVICSNQSRLRLESGNTSHIETIIAFAVATAHSAL